VIIHDEKAIPPWLNIYIYLGGCFLMSTQFFTTCGKAGLCLKHVPKISVRKTIYISGCIRDKSPTKVRAIETIAQTPFSKWRILSEAKKDQVIAKARANATRARAHGQKWQHHTMNIWLLSSKEREDYAGIRIVMNVKLFIDYATCIDKNLTLTGLCGH
jgi:hypothetical protein